MPMATYYHQHVKGGRALLPRLHTRQQQHWLVRFTNLARHDAVYVQCFADSPLLYFYRPDEPLRTAELALRTVEHIRAVRPGHGPGRRRRSSPPILDNPASHP